ELSRKHPHQRRLARPVDADQRHFLASIEREIHSAEDSLVSKSLRTILRDDDFLAAARRRRKIKMNRSLISARRFNQFNPFELLYPALHQRRLARLITKAIDELLYLRDFLLLVLVRAPLHFPPFVPLL